MKRTGEQSIDKGDIRQAEQSGERIERTEQCKAENANLRLLKSSIRFAGESNFLVLRTVFLFTQAHWFSSLPISPFSGSCFIIFCCAAPTTTTEGTLKLSLFALLYSTLLCSVWSLDSCCCHFISTILLRPPLPLPPPLHQC